MRMTVSNTILKQVVKHTCLTALPASNIIQPWHGLYGQPGHVSHAHYQIEIISGSGAVALRLRLIDFCHYLSIFWQYLRTLYIVWSLVRRRVTRRLTRLQTMHIVLKYIKTF